jgi:hypothetical protein
VAFDWLLGPEVVTRDGGSLVIRSLVLDPETVHDVVKEILVETGEGALFRQDPDRDELISFPLDRLATAADWERSRLLARGGVNHQGFLVDLRASTEPVIIYNQASMEPTARKVAAMMLSEGRARPRLRRLVRRLPAIAAAILVLCWVWYLFSQRPPIAFAAAGSLMATAATLMFWQQQERLGRWVGGGHPGHRIRLMSRHEIRNRRADRHANLKLAAITIPAGALIGAVVTLLVRE